MATNKIIIVLIIRVINLEGIQFSSKILFWMGMCTLQKIFITQHRIARKRPLRWGPLQSLCWRHKIKTACLWNEHHVILLAGQITVCTLVTRDLFTFVRLSKAPRHWHRSSQSRSLFYGWHKREHFASSFFFY